MEKKFCHSRLSGIPYNIFKLQTVVKSFPYALQATRNIAGHLQQALSEAQI